MLDENNISGIGLKKLQLYFAALFLFEKGKSHPQIITMLEEYEPDLQLLTSVVDKAMYEEWDKLYLEANSLFSKGAKYDEVLGFISQKEPDKEVAAWICGEWYKLKTLYVDCLIDGRRNRFEGIKWVVVSGIGVFFFFYNGSSWITKTIWIIALFFSVLQWFVGMQQRDIANGINRLFTEPVEVQPDSDVK